MIINLTSIQFKKEKQEDSYIDFEIDSHIKEHEEGAEYVPYLMSFEILKASIQGFKIDDLHHKELHEQLDESKYEDNIIELTIEAWKNYDNN